MHIEIDEISKSFGATAALHPVSLSLPSGALVALLGPSGSGKTTLLRILGGLEFPTSGRVLFDGQDATGLSVQDRRAGFVFQSYALFRHMTVFGNIAYGLNARPRASRPTKAEIARRVTKLLELIQLPDIGARYPSQLSGGQRQRVALARALARSCDRACATFTTRLASQRFSSPTIRMRRWNWPTLSSSCRWAGSSRSASRKTSARARQRPSCGNSSAPDMNRRLTIVG
jgi:ABC-type ATPase involved in cell division